MNNQYADRPNAGGREIEGKYDRLQVVLDILSNYDRGVNRLLDTRCLNGEFTMEMKDAVGAEEVHGFELYENKLEEANKRDMTAISIDYDDEDYPFDDNYFDVVCAVDIIEHLYSPDHFFDEISRILKPNGLFIVATPNLASLHNRLSLLMGYQPFSMNVSRRHPVGHLFENTNHIVDETPPSAHHFRVFTIKSLRQLLEIHSFKCGKVRGGTAVLPDNMRFKRIFKIVEDLLCNSPSLSYEIIIPCINSGDVE